MGESPAASSALNSGVKITAHTTKRSQQPRSLSGSFAGSVRQQQGANRRFQQVDGGQLDGNDADAEQQEAGEHDAEAAGQQRQAPVARAWRYSTAIAAAVGNHSGVKWRASLDSDRLSKASRNVANATNRNASA